jgi:hypothetical protein
MVFNQLIPPSKVKENSKEARKHSEDPTTSLFPKSTYNVNAKFTEKPSCFHHQSVRGPGKSKLQGKE